MKTTFLVLFILINITVVIGQGSSSVVEIVTIYSQNERFYLKSIPFDDNFPTLRGRTFVFEKGNTKPLYSFERGFDSVDDDSNNLILSNDGEVIFYVITEGANEEKEGLNSVTIYKNGKMFKSFTESEINGCDEKKERCTLVYSNYENVIDRDKSKLWQPNYKKVFKDGVNEKEKFLSDFPIFSFNDTIYLTDSKKKVHIFNLKEGNYIASEPFENIYEQIKTKGRFNKIELQKINSPIIPDFPKLKDGKNTLESLANYLDMKSADLLSKDHEKFKLYTFTISCVISRDGSVEVEKIESYDDLPKEKILDFFKTNKFDISFVPQEFDKWYFDEEFFSFRKKDERIARQEKKQEVAKRRQELEKMKTLETINGVYIPKNLEECFIELDKSLSDIDKKEMQTLSNRQGMLKYHFGLGMGLRNRWGLWGSSRLETYFLNRGITHPDDMSAIILEYYHDWLNGKKETWKDWEKNPKTK